MRSSILLSQEYRRVVNKNEFVLNKAGRPPGEEADPNYLSMRLLTVCSLVMKLHRLHSQKALESLVMLLPEASAGAEPVRADARFIMKRLLGIFDGSLKVRWAIE
jgi:hypothetical protein